jgi:SNF2 family DNA or RNA helicase
VAPRRARRKCTSWPALTKLRRAACDPRLVAPELGLVGAKVQEFERLALELVAGRHKALVFSQFTDFLALLRDRLDAAGLRYQYLDGSTPAAQRTQRVAAFQGGEGDFFLISLKAGGFGLNLTMADYVIIADPWWNPAAEDQASGRAHRIGQQRPVTVYRLVTQGSIEDRIVQLHHHKRALAEWLRSSQRRALEWMSCAPHLLLVLPRCKTENFGLGCVEFGRSQRTQITQRH